MPRNFDQWTQIVSGTGASITVDAGKRKANLAAGVGEVAYFRRPVPVLPGDVVEVSVLAKVNSGTPKIIYDYPTFAVPVQSLELGAEGFTEYRLGWIAARDASSATVAVVNIGVFNPQEGDLDIYDPVVTVNGVDIDADVDKASYVEAGSGANGTYQKFGDGTLICRKTVTVTDCTTAWGSVFTSALTGVGVFEKTFVGTPHMSYGTKGSSVGSSAWVFSAGSGTSASVGVARGTSITGTFSIDVTAVGRWK